MLITWAQTTGVRAGGDEIRVKTWKVEFLLSVLRIYPFEDRQLGLALPMCHPLLLKGATAPTYILI